VRPLVEADLDVLFDRSERQMGAAWLPRQARGEVYVAVACLDGSAVGRAGVEFLPEGAHFWAAEILTAFRSRGIGTLLIAHLEQAAAARGYSSVFFEVDGLNLRARALYARLGFRQRAHNVYRFGYRERGRTVNVVDEQFVLAKTLA
jgi:ribosomal protein S18 acetylase RimI-like enzyme